MSAYTSALVAALSATIVAAVLTPLVRGLAVRLNLLDQAFTARRLDGRPVPRLGGLAIVAAFYVALGTLWLTGWPQPPDAPRLTVSFLIGGLCIAALGVYDDLRRAGAGQKLAVQLGVAVLMFVLGLRIEALANPFGPALRLGALSLPFTVAWIVGLINAFNLIDGLDGLASGVCLIAIGTNLVIGLDRNEAVMILISAALAGAVAGFLLYNFNPASIFMGDTGSMFLGFVLATLSLKANQKSSAAVAILIPIVALGLPIFDTLLALVRRAARGRPIFRADREHIHHQLLTLGLSHRQAVLALYALSALLGALAIALTYASSRQTLAVLGGLVGVAFLALSRLGYLGDAERAGLLPQLQAGVDEQLRRVRESDDPQAVWEAVKAVTGMLKADRVVLSWTEEGTGSERVERSYSPAGHQQGSEYLRARFVLKHERRELGVLELAWCGPGHLMNADTRALAERLCAEIVASVTKRSAPHAE